MTVKVPQNEDFLRRQAQNGKRLGLTILRRIVNRMERRCLKKEEEFFRNVDLHVVGVAVKQN